MRALIYENGEKYEYSSFLLLVFLGASLALMKENAYPAKVFVGDTYCYFAGIVFAIAAMFSNNDLMQVKHPLFATFYSCLNL